MNYLPHTLKDALHETIHRHPTLSVSAIAEQLNMAESYLYRSALPDPDTDGPNATGARFPLKQLVPLVKVTGDYRVLDFIEHCLGRVAVSIPEQKSTTDQLQKQAINSAAEFGKMMREVNLAVEDGDICRKEKERICRVGWEAVTAIMQVIKSCE